MFNVRKLLKIAFVSLVFAVGVPVSASASHVTRINHPRANMMFSSDSVYYPSPKISKVPSYELSQIQNWSGHSASGAVTGKPEYVKPLYRTHVGSHEWYKFVKPSFEGDDPVTGWIPDYGLAKYNPKVHHWTKKDERLHDIYVFGIGRHTSKHPVHVVKHESHARRNRRAHMSASVASDLNDAKVSQKFFIKDLERTAKAEKYVKNDVKAARINAGHDHGATRTADYRQINNFVHTLLN